jgi:hypothetical protein
MHITSFAPYALAATVTAQSIKDALAANPQLTEISSIWNKYSSLYGHISMAGRNAVTVLAPINGARGMKELLTYVDGPEATEARAKKAKSGAVEWTLTYHVINGMLPAAKIPTGDSFQKTFVHSAEFANVSGARGCMLLRMAGKLWFIRLWGTMRVLCRLYVLFFFAV